MIHKSLPMERKFIAWLWLLAAMILAMAVIGAITRLTESGLSIVRWDVVTGTLPPFGGAAWQEAFAQYQASPQYQKVNLGMDLAEFKNIYWWEYIHRLWGRVIGLVFFIPLIFFMVKKQIPDIAKKPILVMTALGLLQGFIGWWMVKSGLVNEPMVSPYRLATHLGLAALLFGMAVHLASLLSYPGALQNHKLSKISYVPTALLFITILAGAFVAGLDAGLIYNEFPMMGGRFVPEDYAFLHPFWHNLFENPSAVQFNHRWLGVITVLALWHYWGAAWRRLPKGDLRRGFHIMAFVAFLQLTLGIKTLIFAVPIHLAATHQAFAFLLFGVTIWLGVRVRRAALK